MEQKNWINITRSPSLYCRYAYFDLEDHLADSLFERENVAVKYEQEFVNPVNDYQQFCRDYLDYSENWMMGRQLTA